jgi:hypothetical protein
MSAPQLAIHNFIKSLVLPDRGPAFETAGTPPEYSSKQEVVAVGAQLAEFSTAVSADLRPLISNSMLLAQLAANKATADSASVFDWHEKYRAVLSNIGWQVQGGEQQVQQVSNADLSVHKAIVPVLVAMLGPQVAAVSLVVSVLQGLNDMDKASPWITLFNQSSQSARGAKLQISYVGADDHGEPAISLLALAIAAERTITQVLFFKFSQQKAELRKSTSSLATTAQRLNTDKDVIEGRIRDFINDYVKNVEI